MQFNLTVFGGKCPPVFSSTWRTGGSLPHEKCDRVRLRLEGVYLEAMQQFVVVVLEGDDRASGVKGARASRHEQIAHPHGVLQRVQHGRHDRCACGGGHLRAGRHAVSNHVLRRGEISCGWVWERTRRSLAPQTGEGSKGSLSHRRCSAYKTVATGAVEFPCGVREAKSRSLCLHGRRRPRPHQGQGEYVQSPCYLPRSELDGISNIIILSLSTPSRPSWRYLRKVRLTGYTWYVSTSEEISLTASY